MDELNSGVGLAGELLGPSRPGQGGAAHIELAAQLQARCKVMREQLTGMVRPSVGGMWSLRHPSCAGIEFADGSTNCNALLLSCCTVGVRTRAQAQCLW